jgi:hypothetical protein
MKSKVPTLPRKFLLLGFSKGILSLNCGECDLSLRVAAENILMELEFLEIAISIKLISTNFRSCVNSYSAEENTNGHT